MRKKILRFGERIQELLDNGDQPIDEQIAVNFGSIQRITAIKGVKLANGLTAQEIIDRYYRLNGL